ncbi:hypothetical protein OQA88_10534 [Cercophora sp. LCS_1]
MSDPKTPAPASGDANREEPALEPEVSTKPRPRHAGGIRCCFISQLVMRTASLGVLITALVFFIYPKVAADRSYTDAYIAATNIPPLARSFLLLRRIGPEPYRFEALLGGLWEFGLAIACFAMGLFLRGSGPKPQPCRPESRDCYWMDGVKYEDLGTWPGEELAGVACIMILLNG